MAKQDTVLPGPWTSQVKYQDPATQTYLGSPTLVRLDGGEILAAHDYFGPRSPHNDQGKPHLTSIYRSRDNGLSWEDLAHIVGAHWSTLFVHRGLTYLLGTSAEYGDIVIRRSADGGATWTQPADEESGLLFHGGPQDQLPNYHSSPTPVLRHGGRVYRACENRDPMAWGSGFRAMVLSTAEDADLLRASSWHKSNEVPFPGNLAHKFEGRMEGNIVVDIDGQLCSVMRLQPELSTEGYFSGETKFAINKAAFLRIEDEGRKLVDDPRRSFVDLPGGMSKFTIRRDDIGSRYWVLANDMSTGPPRVHRNILSLFSSADLSSWTRHKVLMEDTLEKTPEDSAQNTGFQYVDWQFDGEDIIYLVRTAFDGAHNYHDSNRITFGTVRDFRRKTEHGDSWNPGE